MSSSVASLATACVVGLLASGCAEEVTIALALHDDAEGQPSGFSCVDDAGGRLLAEPWSLPTRPVVVVEVIRFRYEPPRSARLFDIRETCASGAGGPLDLRPCIVEHRACVHLGPRVGTEPVRRYFERQLAARTGEGLLFEGLDVAMFRVVVTTQEDDPCPDGDYRRPGGDAPPLPPPLTTEGGVVLGCAYSEPLTLDRDRVAEVVLDAPTPCRQADLDQCVDLVPMLGP